jgi:type IV pilus assembly protein PilC
MNGENETKATQATNTAGEGHDDQQPSAQEEAQESQEQTISRRQIKFRSIGMDAITLFCRQLSTLVTVGIPLLKCLQILHQRTSNPKLQSVVRAISQDIEEGTSFSAALGKFPHVFSSFFINMTTVAEKGGSLDEALQVIADVLEKEDLMRQKVRDALFYPFITLIVGLVVIGILVVGVIPMFGQVYARHDFQLPLVTEILLAIGNPETAWVWLLLIAGIVLFAYAYGKSHGNKAFYDRNKLKLPLFGPLFIKLYVARFARNFGTLIRGGVPMLQALDVVKDTSENVVIAEAVEQAVHHVERGGRLEQPLREADVFPDIVVDMIATGEEAGKLDLMLAKIADLYDGEVERAINTLTTSLQPILIVILGLLTAFIAAAMFWPYFKLADVLGAGF